MDDSDPDNNTDSDTTIRQLRDQVAAFARERDWEQFHTPKDLAVGLSIEAAELLELFLWKSPPEVEELTQQPDARQRVAEELADILIFSLNLTNRLDLDLAAAVHAKLAANAAKYPVEKAKGSSKKYTAL
jgi:NTP pyrophosphatase (non-canonical NTP hydrolase)